MLALKANANVFVRMIAFEVVFRGGSCEISSFSC